MNPEEPVQVIQKAATVQDIINDHMAGLSGYQIADKYGLDTERVKVIINDADRRGAFIPKEADVDNLDVLPENQDTLIQPLPEGEEPKPGSTKGHK